jgi:hypothetical protein
MELTCFHVGAVVTRKGSGLVSTQWHPARLTLKLLPVFLDALPDFDLLRPCVLTNDLLEPEIGVASELSVLRKTNSRPVARPERRSLTCAADLSLRG